MISKEDMITAFARNVDIVKRQVLNLSHDQTLVQPPVPGNCMNWILGHIVGTRHGILKLLGEKPLISEEMAKRYGYGSPPVCEDGPDVVKLDVLLNYLEKSQPLIEAALRRMTDADLAQPTQSHLGTTTVAQLIFFNYYHETYHAGQLELLREMALAAKT